MDNDAHLCLKATDRSYLALIKKQVHQITMDAAFPANRVAETDIITSELASNLIKHAGGGELLVRYYQQPDNEYLEIISIDNGPGMADPQKMIEDGISTVNTLGQGLGAVKRLSQEFDIYSIKGWGTIILARIYKTTRAIHPHKSKIICRQLNVPKTGQTLSGDGHFVKMGLETVKILVGDGLGHGQEANKAVNEAIKAFRTCAENTPSETIKYIHSEVRKTRGLVGTVVFYNVKEKKWLMCGVGNIACRTVNTTDFKNHMSYNGIIGMNIPTTLKNTEITPVFGDILVLCSDGIQSRLDISKYPQILRHDLTILIATIYKDFNRGNDDVSVLACKPN